MKRIPLVTVAALALLVLAGRASALPIPLQVGGSELEVAGLGIGDYSYTDNAMAAPLWLDEGSHYLFNFGHVDVPFALAGGFVELTIHLLSPTPDGAFADLGAFGIVAIFNKGFIDLEWGGPSYTGYSSGGASGGILALNMRDIEGHFKHGFDLIGTIKNVKSPTQVAEPGLLLLLGGGLLAVAGMRRRKQY